MKIKKKRVLLLIGILLYGFTFVYSQDTNMLFKQVDINKKNKLIFKLLRKSDCSNEIEKVKVINVFWCIYRGEFNKSSILNKDFLLNIEPVYFHYKAKYYLKAETFIYKDDGNLFAVSDGRNIYCLSNYNETAYLGEKKLIKKILELEIEKIFYLSLTPLKTYFAVDKKNEVYVLKIEGEQLRTYLLVDYVNNHWTEINK